MENLPGTGNSSERQSIPWKEIFVSFAIIIIGFLAVWSFGFLFTEYVLKEIDSGLALLAFSIVLSLLYVSISVASGNFLYLPRIEKLV